MTKETEKHVNATTWEKGVSGNPGGRSPRIGPNGETASQLARMYTVEAITCLATIVNDKNAMVLARVAAANALLDRGWGKPTEYIEASLQTSTVPIIQIVRIDPNGAN